MKADLAARVTLTALGLLMTLGDGASAQALLLPAATLPVIWRRRAPDAAALTLAAGILVTAGLPRCGAVIPAALLVLYALGDRRAAPAGVLGALVVLAFTDPIISPAALAFILPLGIGAWGVGRLVRSRDRVAHQLAARSDELERQRERTAELAVALERTRLAGALDVTARDRTRRMVELAEHGGDFGEIERLGRDSLNELRELLGALRGDVAPEREPLPTLAQLTSERIIVAGEPRPLPGGVELTAYRIVEHALAGERPARVALRYRPDGLELELRDVTRDTVAIARERVLAQGGSFSAGADVLRARLHG